MKCIVCNREAALHLSKDGKWGICGSEKWCLLRTQLCPIEPHWILGDPSHPTMYDSLYKLDVRLMKPTK